ncbi:MAG: hypothetical protein IKI83_09150 [Prevotella sp.]|nr:hypothetical protein [Prevotella sp.]
MKYFAYRRGIRCLMEEGGIWTYFACRQGRWLMLEGGFWTYFACRRGRWLM